VVLYLADFVRMGAVLAFWLVIAAAIVAAASIALYAVYWFTTHCFHALGVE